MSWKYNNVFGWCNVCSRHLGDFLFIFSFTFSIFHSRMAHTLRAQNDSVVELSFVFIWYCLIPEIMNVNTSRSNWSLIPMCDDVASCALRQHKKCGKNAIQHQFACRTLWNSHLVQKITTFLSCYFFMSVMLVILAHGNVVAEYETYVIESTQVSCLFALSLLFMPHSSLNSCKNARNFRLFWLIPAKQTQSQHDTCCWCTTTLLFLPIRFYCIHAFIELILLCERCACASDASRLILGHGWMWCIVTWGIPCTLFYVNASILSSDHR